MHDEYAKSVPLPRAVRVPSPTQGFKKFNEANPTYREKRGTIAVCCMRICEVYLFNRELKGLKKRLGNVA